MTEQNKYKLTPFLLIMFMYFIIGFLTNVNGQFQAPLQVAFLSQVGGLKNTLTTLISFSFFFGYLVSSPLGGVWLNKLGYKPPMIRGLIFMIIGLDFCLASSLLATKYSEVGFSFGENFLPLGYFVFLLGSFLLGTSSAVLQVAINPFVNAYELPHTQPVQRMNIVCAMNSIGTTIAPFFVTGVVFAGVAITDVQTSQLIFPLIALMVCATLFTILVSFCKIPDIAGTFSQEKLPRSIWSFSHLKWGVITIFFYVGAEVAIGVNINLSAMDLIAKGHSLSFFGNETLTFYDVELGIPALLATIYWGGFLIGRGLSSFLQKVSARFQLVTTAVLALILTVFSIATQNLWALSLVGLCHSVMWGSIFSLAIIGLKQYTSKASTVFMMGVFGGAVIPLVQGIIADSLGGWRWSWGVIVVCELMMLNYALIKSYIKPEELEA